MSRSSDAARSGRNNSSRSRAVNHLQPWSGDELEWLLSWDGTEEYLAELAELAELLGRTIESCRQRFYAVRNGTVTVTETETRTTTTTYRGWMEGDGDGWD